MARRPLAIFVCIAVLAANVPVRLVYEAALPAGGSLASADSGAVTSLVSISSSAAQGNGASTLAVDSGGVSADGRFVVFESDATNLAPNDTNSQRDVFVRDRQLGTTSVISLNTSGLPGNGPSTEPTISDDGRLIAFVSDASDLVSGDTNGTGDVFVRDRVAGTTTLVSVSISGASGNGRANHPRISASGRFVAFDDRAFDLVQGDTANVTNTFVRDLVARTTRRVSGAPDGSQANGGSINPFISADGRFVNFVSNATNLGVDLGGVDPTLNAQIYLRDLQTGTLELISVTASGKGATGGVFNGPISSDGRLVLFGGGTNSDLLPGTCCGNLYLRDRVAGMTTRINSGNATFTPSMSSDGRFVLLDTLNALTAEDTNVTRDVYLLDRSTGSFTLVSVTPGGRAGSGDSFPAAISPDGRFAAFFSLASDLVATDTNGFQDVFLRDLGPRGDFGTSFPFTFGIARYMAFSQDPVNLATGSFVSHADDLVLPGRALGFGFTRWYNSADSSSGPLGQGWTHSFNWRLTDAGATVSIRRGDGRVDIFTRNADGTYAGPPGVFDTLVKNADGTYLLTLVSQTAYNFSSPGTLIRVSEPAGSQIVLTYTVGNLTSITETVGRVVTLGYDASSRLTSLTDPLGRKVTYGYDATGRLVTVTDKIGNAVGQTPALHQWQYAYDGASSHITTVTDPDGRARVTNSYDGQGRVTQQRDGRSALTTFSYGTGQTLVTDPRGHATTYTFDARMRLVSQSDGVGAVTLTLANTYDAAGNLTSVTDRSGSRTDLAYDARGNLLTKTDPQLDALTPRFVTRFSYDSKNNPVQITDPEGFVTTLTYDLNSNVLLSVSRQIDGTTSALTKYEYTDPANRALPTRIIAPRGNTSAIPDATFATVLTYDGKANLLTRSDPDGARSTFAYDDAGRVTSFVDPDGNVAGAIAADHRWLVAYDQNDRETSRTDPLGNLLRYTYDGAGNRTSVADRNGNVTLFTYDGNTRLAAIQQQPDAFNNPTLVYTTQLIRDANGNATRITQANGVATDYTFDELNRLVSVATHPSANTTLTTSYVLDGNGKPTSRTSGDGVVLSFTYDALSRLTNVSGPAPLSITYAYDELSRRTRMSDATGTTTYSYDGLGRLIQFTSPNGSLSYAYDRDGNRTALSYPGGQTVTYAFSPGGRLTRLTDWAPRVASYGYLPSGLVSVVTYPNGMQASYTYDRAQRLTGVTNSVGGSAIKFETYTLDGEGNRTGRTDDPLRRFSYSFDGLGRLNAVVLRANDCLDLCGPTIPNTLEAFAYDGATNITTTSRGSPPRATATFTYDQANRLSSDGTRSFGWSAADRLIQRGTDTFSYDALDRLTTATVSGVTRTYGYDGDGVLRSRSQGADTTSFLYDVSTAPASLAQVGAERIVNGLGPVYRVHADGTMDAFARDGLGSVVAEVSAAGTITNSFSYSAYGTVTTSGALPLLGFAGELTDPSALIYLRARWYDPTVGRFMSRDPVSGSAVSPASLNRFVYAAGSPTMRTDPSGLCTDPGGPGVRYCIDRFIPTGSSCVLVVCFRGDNRGPQAESGAEGYRVRQLILSDGSVRNSAGLTRLEPFGWPARTGDLEGCTIQTDPGAIDVACNGKNGLVPIAPLIRTSVQIKVVNGRVTVSAAGTRYPSLEIWQYGDNDLPRRLYFYDARAANPFDLITSAPLPNSNGGGK